MVITTSSTQETLNPFVHRVELTTTYEKLKTAVFTVIVLPIRLLLIAGLLVLAWCLACIGLYGLTEEELTGNPITGWRRWVKNTTCMVVRFLTMVMGFHYIKYKGKRASRREAPIVVLAPHSSFLDAVVLISMGSPAFVSRIENSKLPICGKLINFTQPVYVRRDDPDSRQKTIQDIIDRTTSEKDWAQVLIFPEGTCTNRSCLITFKQGAFYPGVPVQPVILRYPNKIDTVTWTWEGPGSWEVMWLTLTRPHTNCEIEFLPVYVPSEEEKADPKLYANNVRKLMAKSLCIPTSEYSYEDCRLVTKSKALQLPTSSLLLQTERLRSRLGISRQKVEELLFECKNVFQIEKSVQITSDVFATKLGLTANDHELSELFHLFRSKESSNEHRIDFTKYLLATVLITKSKSKDEMVELAFQLCADRMNKLLFKHLMDMVYCMPDEHSEVLFDGIRIKGTDCKYYVDYEKFTSYANEYPDTVFDNNWRKTVDNDSSCKKSN